MLFIRSKIVRKLRLKVFVGCPAMPADRAGIEHATWARPSQNSSQPPDALGLQHPLRDSHCERATSECWPKARCHLAGGSKAEIKDQREDQRSERDGNFRLNGDCVKYLPIFYGSAIIFFDGPIRMDLLILKQIFCATFWHQNRFSR